MNHLKHRVARWAIRHASRAVNRALNGITYWEDPPDCVDCLECCDYQFGFGTFCPTHEGSPAMTEGEQLARLGVDSLDELWEESGQR